MEILGLSQSLVLLDKKYLDKIKNSVKFSAIEIGKYFKKTRKKGDKHAA